MDDFWAEEASASVNDTVSERSHDVVKTFAQQVKAYIKSREYVGVLLSDKNQTLIKVKHSTRIFSVFRYDPTKRIEEAYELCDAAAAIKNELAEIMVQRVGNRHGYRGPRQIATTYDQWSPTTKALYESALSAIREKVGTPPGKRVRTEPSPSTPGAISVGSDHTNMSQYMPPPPDPNNQPLDDIDLFDTLMAGMLPAPPPPMAYPTHVVAPDESMFPVVSNAGAPNGHPMGQPDPAFPAFGSSGSDSTNQMYATSNNIAMPENDRKRRRSMASSTADNDIEEGVLDRSTDQIYPSIPPADAIQTLNELHQHFSKSEVVIAGTEEGQGQKLAQGVYAHNGVLKAVRFVATSDRRLKIEEKNITDEEAERLFQIPAKTYQMNPDMFPHLKGQTFVGIMAQDIQKQFPDAVITDADGNLAVDMTQFVALIAANVQRHEKRLRDMEAMMKKYAKKQQVFEKKTNKRFVAVAVMGALLFSGILAIILILTVQSDETCGHSCNNGHCSTITSPPTCVCEVGYEGDDCSQLAPFSLYCSELEGEECMYGVEQLGSGFDVVKGEFVGTVFAYNFANTLQTTTLVEDKVIRYPTDIGFSTDGFEDQVLRQEVFGDPFTASKLEAVEMYGVSTADYSLYQQGHFSMSDTYYDSFETDNSWREEYLYHVSTTRNKYAVDQGDVSTLALDSEFQAHVDALTAPCETSSTDECASQYFNLIQKYGTHVFDQLLLGGSIKVQYASTCDSGCASCANECLPPELCAAASTELETTATDFSAFIGAPTASDPLALQVDIEGGLSSDFWCSGCSWTTWDSSITQSPTVVSGTLGVTIDKLIANATIAETMSNFVFTYMSAGSTTLSNNLGTSECATTVESALATVITISPSAGLTPSWSGSFAILIFVVTTVLQSLRNTIAG